MPLKSPSSRGLSATAELLVSFVVNVSHGGVACMLLLRYLQNLACCLHVFVINRG